MIVLKKATSKMVSCLKETAFPSNKTELLFTHVQTAKNLILRDYKIVAIQFIQLVCLKRIRLYSQPCIYSQLVEL
jgi:hypothetical protein